MGEYEEKQKEVSKKYDEYRKEFWPFELNRGRYLTC